MKRFLAICIALTVLSAAPPARASLIDASFSGEVISQIGTSFVIHQAISGEFVYDTAANSFSSFTIGGEAAPAGFTSSIGITPGLTDALYKAEVTTSGAPADVFALDLSSLSTWPTSDAVALLTNTSQLSTNLDTVNNPLSAFPSSFDYYIASTSTAGLMTVTADLTTFSATTIPEPYPIWIVIPGLLALICLRRRA
jgi:hypothetical protein